MFEKIRSSLGQYNNFLKESKNSRKKIRVYYKRNLIYFLITLIYGIISFVLAYLLAVATASGENVHLFLISLIIALLYSFTIFTSISTIFLIRYILKISLAGDLLYCIFELNRMNNEMNDKYDINNIKKFQNRIRNFDNKFSIFFIRYFKNYKTRIRVHRELIIECYLKFDKILTLVSLNIEFNSNKSTELLNDFLKFVNEVKEKLFLKMLDKTVLIKDPLRFFNNWDAIFRKNYEDKYRQSEKYLEKHRKDFQENRKFRRDLKYKILITILQTVIPIIISIILIIVFDISLP